MEKTRMVNKVVVLLEHDEYSTLLNMAIDDLRNPADELRHILRMEIERRNKKLESIEVQENPNHIQEVLYE
jgi:hypothetical protein